MASRRKVARRAFDGDNREGNSSTRQVASKAVGETPNFEFRIMNYEFTIMVSEF